VGQTLLSAAFDVDLDLDVDGDLDPALAPAPALDLALALVLALALDLLLQRTDSGIITNPCVRHHRQPLHNARQLERMSAGRSHVCSGTRPSK
jgi:hypothetical protein